MSIGDDFGEIAWRILRTSLAETLGRVSSMDEERQGSGKVKIKRKGGQLGRDSQFKGIDLACEEVGERGGKGNTFFFGSGKVAARRVQQFLRHTPSFTGITTTVQPLLKASPSRRHDGLVGDATAATISNTSTSRPVALNVLSRRRRFLFASLASSVSHLVSVFGSRLLQVLKGAAASLSALVISTTIFYVNESTVASGDEKL